MRRSFACMCALALVFSGCGDDDGNPVDRDGGNTGDGSTTDTGTGADTGTPDGGGDPDGGGGDDAAIRCAADSECDDGNPCNGVETCGATGHCEAGTALADGDACDADDDTETVEFCVDGLCSASRCGDEIVDESAEEECDDGNSELGDGCDDCRFSCQEDADCDDGEDCTGTETCDTDTHACVAGTALDNGTACANDTGVCTDGRCLPDACETTEDCDDENPCNGIETCNDTAMTCELADPPDCDDDNACTADSCSATASDNCLNLLIDMDGDGQSPDSLGACGTDCDDDDPGVYEGAVDACDGIDNDCDGNTDEGGVSTWHADCDLDRFAAAGAVSIDSCAEPPLNMTGCSSRTRGWTTIAPTAGTIDCNDANPDVHPGRHGFYTMAIPDAEESVDYDYNCDEMEEPQYPDNATCRSRIVIGGGTVCANVREGWVSSTIPECGATAQWTSTCALNDRGSCVPLATRLRRTQGCR